MDFELSHHATQRLYERKIKHEWIRQALDSPDYEVADPFDNTVRHVLKRIEKMNNRVLRVVHKPNT